ncbi:MAG: hypothetical protein HYX76_15155 [Acidobacteria bacterium]|nr:hypothetical protein [Acidobacteriota bacterium]
MNYPEREGLTRYAKEGYELKWRRDDKPRNDGEQPLLGEEHGIVFVYKVKDEHTALTLYKMRRS